MPGNRKTLIAKAVASRANATSSIRMSGSDLVQKFVGEGARLVKGCVPDGPRQVTIHPFH
ncbi:MAG: AAA family ATPase [Methanolobus sp.]